MFTYTNKSKIKYSTLKHAMAAVFALLMLALAAQPADAGIAREFSSELVANEIEEAPDALSWSPDGTMLAFVTYDGLRLYDIFSKSIKEVDLDRVSFVRWFPDNTILAIQKKGKKRLIKTIDPMSLEITDIELELRPDAAFPVNGGKSLLLLTTAAKEMKIGTDVSFKLHIYDIGTKETKEVHSASRILSVKDDEVDFRSGLMHAGPNPADTIFLSIFNVNPPALPPYLLMETVDFITGKSHEVVRVPVRKFSSPTSWSPNGRRFAITDDSGKLVIADLRGEMLRPATTASGLYPSWNPQGSQIYLGGRLTDSSGLKTVDIIPNGDSLSYAEWSHDGRLLAVVNRDQELWVIWGLAPSYLPPDAALSPDTVSGIKKLKDLLSSGLINEDEYTERYNKLFWETGGSE